MAQNEVHLAVVSAEHVLDTRSLLAALRDDDLRGTDPRVSRGEPDPGQLGLADEVIRLTVSPEVGAALAGVLGTWLTTGRRVLRLRLTKRDRELELESGTPRDAARLVEQVEEFLAQE